MTPYALSITPRALVTLPQPPQPRPLEPWLVAELARGVGHFDGFTWLLDPPRDEDRQYPPNG
jgi:hypothetical protein